MAVADSLLISQSARRGPQKGLCSTANPKGKRKKFIADVTETKTASHDVLWTGRTAIETADAFVRENLWFCDLGNLAPDSARGVEH
jgi:hypothetical protein